METGASIPPARPTPEQARAALEDAEHVQQSIARLSATPWPLWFTTHLTAYCAAMPVVLAGMLTTRHWLLPRGAWVVVGVVMVAAFYAMFLVAATRRQRRTGVSLRLDAVPKRASVLLILTYLGLTVAALVLFQATGRPLYLFAASAVGVAWAVGFPWFVRRQLRTP